MKVVQVQFTPWDKVYNFDPDEFDLKKDDYVIVKTELGSEIGRVVSFLEEDPGDKELKPVIRKANSVDLEKLDNLKERKEALEICREKIDKYNLPMKLIDVSFSFDESRITFAFVADGRIDFRDLVKELTSHFNRTVRLQQIGIRDEARLNGDCGPCGRKLCCRGHLKNNITSITSEMAEVQQVAHRGSDRISGICGRLMCCLAYEEAGYKELIKTIPQIGTKVNVDGRKGEVIGFNALKQSVNVRFPKEKGEKNSVVVEVDLNRNKK